MPPPLAAFLCVGFILWLFRRDSREFGRLSPALWVPLVWVCINASRPVVYWFATGDTAAQATDISEGNSIDRNIYLALMGIGILILARRRVDWNHITRNCRWLLLLYAFYLLSVVWSPDPFIGFKRWFKDAGDILMILILLTETDPVEAIRVVFVRCAYVLVPVSVLFIKYYATLGRYTHKWTYQTYYCGVSSSKNGLGLLAMMGGVFLLWQIVDVHRQRGKRLTLRTIWPELSLLLMCLWILNLAQCATAITCFIVGATILLGARLVWVKTNLRRLGWCVFGLALVMLAFTVSPGFRGLVAGVLGRDATLTDRTLIWDMALKSGSNPVIGSGFDSYWLTKKGDAIIEEFHVKYAHNGYLETYLNTGWIGVLLLLGMFRSGGRNVISQFSSGRIVGYLFMAIFWSSLLFNYTEIAFGRSNVLGLLISLMAAYGPFVPSVREALSSAARSQRDMPESPAFAGTQNMTKLSGIES